jgi:uncharacterized protein YqjF (DUF2071 family)
MTTDFDYSVVEDVGHRAYPLPRGPWLMTQSWHDLLFAHWRVDVAELRRAVPAAFDLDLFHGEAWLGIVPFGMRHVGPRGLPDLPGVSAFLELNVRTYVRVDDRPGVFFFSLDAASSVAVTGARAFLNLPYYRADMTLARHDGDVHYRSERRSRQPATFEATYSPVGDPFRPVAGSREHFLTERYCLYQCTRRGKPYRLDLHHRPWTLQVARADIATNTMADGTGVTLRGAPELLHVAKPQDVVAWAPARLVARDRRSVRERSHGPRAARASR